MEGRKEEEDEGKREGGIQKTKTKKLTKTKER